MCSNCSVFFYGLLKFFFSYIFLQNVYVLFLKKNIQKKEKKNKKQKQNQKYFTLSQMNGLCGSTTISTASTAVIQDRSIGGNIVGGITGSPNRRGVVGQNSTGSGSITGIGQPLITNQGTDTVRKSRSQGGKKLQKCLSTASYGEESSFSRPQMTPLSHNLLMTRQYCSFGSTTSLNHL